MEQKINLDILLESIDGIAYRCLNDKQWTMEFITSGIERLTGYTQEEILNNSEVSFDDLTLEEDKEKVRKAVDYALANKQYYTLEFRIRHKNGNIVYMWEQGVGVYDGDKIVALERYLCDITAQKQTEIELKKKIEEQAKELIIEREKEIERTNYLRVLELTKSMAHELRNPLNLSTNSCSLLKDEITKTTSDNSYKMTRLLEILQTANSRINHIIETIELTFRSIAHKRECLSLLQLLDECISTEMRNRLSMMGILIRLDDSIKDYEIYVTKESFVRAVRHLLDNAINAVKELKSSTRKVITITAFNEINNDNLIIKIRDEGIGISKSNLEMITLPFYSSSVRSQGSGLGLPAAKYLLQDDRIDITFESKEDEWTEVSLSVPRKYWKGR